MVDEADCNKRADQTSRLAFYKRPGFKIYQALILVFFSALFLSLCDVIVKSISYMTASQIAFMRYMGLFSTNLPFMIASRQSVFEKPTVPVLLARGVFGCLALYLIYLSKKLMPIAESAVIISTTPIWVTIFARIFLKERLSVLNYVSIACCIVGLLLMSKIFSVSWTSKSDLYDDMNFWYGCLAALTAALFAAITFVFLRKLKSIHPCVTITYQSTVGIVGMVVFELIVQYVNLPNCGLDSVLLLSMGPLSFLGQFAVTLAFRYEKAGTISVVSMCSSMVIQYFFQIFYFNEPPDVFSILAAVCVVCSLVLAVLSKYRQHQRLTKAEHAKCREDTPKCETDV